ncbi:MAG TPA: helix-turn-helix transcriptional regulator [Longimicrobiaceae bacterium]|nr:helix-turn-helix transcriptional regulator [Longimicrobiaceae bacterium]
MRTDEFFRRLDEEFPTDPAVAAEVDPPHVLASNVYRLRKDRGLTQDQLAEAVGVRQPRIAEVERGDANPRLLTLSKLAFALGVPVAALLDPDYLDRLEEPAPAVEYQRTPSPARRVAEPRPRASE